MKFNLIYQLNCNKNHNLCFYVRIKRSKATIFIYCYKDRNPSLYMVKELSFHPISCGWIGDDIYLLSEKECVCLELNSGSFISLVTPQYKIADILLLESANNFLYASIIDPDCIDIYKKIDETNDIKVASYFFEHDRTKIVEDQISNYEKSIIREYIYEYRNFVKTGIYDVIQGYSIKIEYSSLYSKLFINGKCVKKEFGFIDRAFFWGDRVIYSISSLNSPARIKLISFKRKVSREYRENSNCNNMITVIYCSEDIPFVYHYKLYNSSRQRGIIVMLHGGPASRYSNRFDSMVYTFVKAGFIVYLLNYTGSTGYGYEYQKALYGNAGIVDCAEVRDCLQCLKLKYSVMPLYLVGDSYGGYLAILVLLKSEKFVTKAYATNAFTDIRHQFLFSCARSVIKKYFQNICSPQIRDINPIDLVSAGQLDGKLFIINGYNDSYCPKEQILQFSNISGCTIRFLSDYPHYKVDYADVMQISDIIMNDIGVD